MKSLEGAVVGDTREAVVIFPDDWEPPAYRGVQARAIMQMRELFEWDLEELTLDMLKELVDGVESVEEAKERLLGLEKMLCIRRTEEAVEQEVMKQLAKLADMEVSETAINETGRLRYQETLVKYQNEVFRDCQISQFLQTL